MVRIDRRGEVPWLGHAIYIDPNAVSRRHTIHHPLCLDHECGSLSFDATSDHSNSSLTARRSSPYLRVCASKVQVIVCSQLVYSSTQIMSKGVIINTSNLLSVGWTGCAGFGEYVRQALVCYVCFVAAAFRVQDLQALSAQLELKHAGLYGGQNRGAQARAFGIRVPPVMIRKKSFRGSHKGARTIHCCGEVFHSRFARSLSDALRSSCYPGVRHSIEMRRTLAA
jgi:hypothetical protein